MEHLPDLALCRIFDFIPAKEYLKLMLVNQKFYDLLQLNRFSGQVLLIIMSCRLHPNDEPWKFLIKSNRKFPSIFVDCTLIKGLENSEEFWRKIGEKTIELKLRNKKPRQTFIPEDFLTYFPNLKKICVLPNIKVLNGVIFPLHISILLVYQHNFGQELDAEKFKNLRFFGTNWFLNFIKLKEEEELEYIEDDFRRVLYKRFENIQVTPMNFLNVKKLYARDLAGMQGFDFYPLSQSIHFNLNFLNLKYLNLKLFDVNGCFFVHKLVQFHSLNEFLLLADKSNKCCDECCNFLAQSCPNITYLTLHAYGFFGLIEAVAKNKKLKQLFYLTKKIRLVDVIFPTLRKLIVFGDLDLEGLQPSLHILTFLFLNNDALDLELLFKSFPNVTFLTVGFNFDHNLNESYLKLMGKYLKNLRILHCGNIKQKRAFSKFASMAFEHIPILIDFSYVTRWMVEENPNDYI